MPTIPFLKPDTELAMPEVVTPDRVPRPKIDVHGVLDAMGDLGRASQRPLINPEPFVDAAGAKGKATASAWLDAGRLLHGLGEKVRIEKSRTGGLELDAAMDDATAKNLAHQQGNPHDTSTWGKAAHGFISWIGNLLHKDKRLTGPERDQAGGKVRKWANTLQIDTEAAVAKQTFLNSKNALLARADTYFGHGNLKDSTLLYREGFDADLFDKATFEGRMQKVHAAGVERDTSMAFGKVMGDEPDLAAGLQVVRESRFLAENEKPKLVERVKLTHATTLEELQAGTDMANDPTGTLLKLADPKQYPLMLLSNRTDMQRGGAMVREVYGQRELAQAKDVINSLPPDRLATATIGTLGIKWHDASDYHRVVAQWMLDMRRSANSQDIDIPYRTAVAAANAHRPEKDPTGVMAARISTLADTLPDEQGNDVKERLAKAVNGDETHRLTANAVAVLHDITQGSRRAFGPYEVQAVDKDNRPMWEANPAAYSRISPAIVRTLINRMGPTGQVGASPGELASHSINYSRIGNMAGLPVSVDKAKLAAVQQKVQEITEALQLAAKKGKFKEEGDSMAMMTTQLRKHGGKLDSSDDYRQPAWARPPMTYEQAAAMA